MVSRVVVSLFLFTFIFCCTPCAAATEKVLVLQIEDSITPASDDILADAIAFAEEGDYQVLVITLNTPGGVVDATLNMMEQIANTNVPVIGYVYPEGTKSWSAGTLLLISTDVAAMAPFTVIGSAQPVTMTPSGSEPINDSKIVNALVAMAQENARKYGRNETAAGQFITENLNLNPEKALEYGVIEYIASDLNDLLDQVDGQEVKGRELKTSGADIVFYKPSLRLSFLNTISDPVLSSLLLLLGVYALILGLSHPGIGGEIFGLISISLGLVGTGFDVNIASIFLILVGVALIIIEFQSPGLGIFGIVGLVCIVAGSMLLAPTDFPRNYTPAGFQQTILLSVVAPTIAIGVFLLFVLYKVAIVRHSKPKFGELLGDIAVAQDSFGPGEFGYVRHKSENWKARSEDYIEKGNKVEILEKDGTVLIVKKIDEKYRLSE
ncbi:nodulation protein NfeD [uncultured Methanomethylovorans sp.]|uniref:NfeD family protein n=1 Tax=uncultured Methanomethylovorans sp. TaxID=183759 RepID=UPI002AA6318B|nr:nodulation protein NfeD [uncultured Methanomethylovorans sp.]